MALCKSSGPPPLTPNRPVGLGFRCRGWPHLQPVLDQQQGVGAQGGAQLGQRCQQEHVASGETQLKAAPVVGESMQGGGGGAKSVKPCK